MSGEARKRWRHKTCGCGWRSAYPLGAAPDKLSVTTARSRLAEQSCARLACISPGRVSRSGGTSAVGAHTRADPCRALPRPRQGYAKTKVSSIFQPLAESILVDQPGDPIDYMVKCVAFLHSSSLADSVYMGSPMW